MNDPHVVSLSYHVESSKQVTYDDPPPLEIDRDAYSMRLEANTLTVTMKDHFATEEAAHAAVEPLLRAWEIDSSLRRNRPDLTFDFMHSRIIDRNPPPSQGGQLEPVRLYGRMKATGDLRLHVTSRVFPSPPRNFAASPDVQTMWFRYRMYLEGKEPLLSMAYACLSLLEGTTGRKSGARAAVCAKYHIDPAVREKLGNLVSEKGSPEEARKLDHAATKTPLTGEERDWIEQVIKALIRRKAEYDYDTDTSFAAITLNDFPKM
jgi:hypothetical protein